MIIIIFFYLAKIGAVSRSHFKAVESFIEHVADHFRLVYPWLLFLLSFHVLVYEAELGIGEPNSESVFAELHAIDCGTVCGTYGRNCRRLWHR